MPLTSYYESFKFGSVWYLEDATVEANWKFKNPFVRRFDRQSHPLLSVLDWCDAGVAERVPVLFGSTGDRQWAFVVRGLSRDRPADHPTSFSDALLPLPASTFVTVDSVLRRKLASPNQHRPLLSREDQVRLRRWLRARGGRQGR